METGLALAPSAASPSSMGRQEMATAISTKYSRSNDMALTPKQRGIRHLDEGGRKLSLCTYQVWSLTQFYSVDFSKSRIGVNKCVFYKRTIKVCISCR